MSVCTVQFLFVLSVSDFYEYFCRAIVSCVSCFTQFQCYLLCVLVSCIVIMSTFHCFFCSVIIVFLIVIGSVSNRHTLYGQKYFGGLTITPTGTVMTLHSNTYTLIWSWPPFCSYNSFHYLTS